jgi:hypothetical protein
MKIISSFMIILFLTLSLAFAGESIDPLWIGIVKTDGILVPIGTYFKDEWVNSWPAPSIDQQPEENQLVKTTNGKIYLQDIPADWTGAIKAIPTKVYLWPEERGPLALDVLYAARYKFACASGWALQTNFHQTKEIKLSPTRKSGVITNNKIDAIPFEAINTNNKIALPLIQAIKTKFDEKERVSPRVSLRDREKGLIELSRIYRARHEIYGRSLYFIEAQRKYPKPRDAQDASCYNLNSLSSWVMLQDNKVIFLSSDFIASDCDGKGVSHIIPDIVISTGGKRYVVSERYGYESESYTIQLILDGSMKEVLRADGGGC